VRRFEGKVAVVTGSTRGIGLAVAERLASEGARVAVNARKSDEVESALRYLTDRGYEAIGVTANITHEDGPGTLVQRAVEAWGAVDYVVNNVGISPFRGPLMEIDRGAFEKTMLANTWPAVATVQCAMRAGMPERQGAVVNMSIAPPNGASTVSGTYVASKAALDALTRCLARELGPSLVRVNGVGPGLVRTKQAQVLWDGPQGRLHRDLVPLRRLAEPADIAAVVAFLLSDDAGTVTGTVVRADAGFVLIGGDPESLDAAAAWTDAG
jgi:3-oxoacyl-[acyl-carrier protein] reductase